jgi:hypothetical protein
MGLPRRAIPHADGDVGVADVDGQKHSGRLYSRKVKLAAVTRFVVRLRS